MGEDLVYNNSKPFGKIVREIRRGAKLPIDAWKAVEGDDSSSVKKVAFKHFSEGLIDERLPGFTAVPPGAEDAVLYSTAALTEHFMIKENVPISIAVRKRELMAVMNAMN